MKRKGNRRAVKAATTPVTSEHEQRRREPARDQRTQSQLAHVQQALPEHKRWAEEGRSPYLS